MSGAGPSGLVAAKTLLHNAPEGAFKVSVFDAQDEIGGLWPISKEDTHRQVHPLMVANQSKHTMHFSEMAWEDDAPQFPRAWETGQYLVRYFDRFLKGNSSFESQLGSRVVKAARRGDDSTGHWDIVVRSGEHETTRHFDYLLIASGFFGKPIIPEQLSNVGGVPVMHSSRYRDIKGLLGKGRPGGGKILVVGGQMSGVEIAGTIASHLSSEINSPEQSEIADIESFSVHHVIQRPIWVFPLHTSPMVSTCTSPKDVF